MAEVTNKITTTDAASTAQQASTNSPNKKKAPGLTFKRLHTKAGVSPYDEIEWELRTANISDAKGNVMVVSTHNTDITDAWEREGEDPRYFYQFSPDGYALGINVILYAMTH